MATVEIDAGVCGFTTTVEAVLDGETCRLRFDSPCNAIKKMAERLETVDPFSEISTADGPPEVFRVAAECCPHAACPVPVGVIKAIEVEAGLALPKDVTIRVSR